MSDAELRTLEHELRAAPDAPDLHERRARILLRLGRMIEATAALDLALRLGAVHLRKELAGLLDALAFKDERVGTTFRLVPGGPFLMGDDKGDEDEKPRHLVRLAPFYCAESIFRARFEDSFQISSVAAARDLANRTFHRRGKYERRVRGEEQGASMDWNVAIALLDELTKLSGIEHRLPTEAEWERVRRAHDEGLPYGIDVGTPYEFTADFYDSTAYDADRGQGGTRFDPRGPRMGVHRVVRGVAAENTNVPFVQRPSWRDSASEQRRMPQPGYFADGDHGGMTFIYFRLVRPVPA